MPSLKQSGLSCNVVKNASMKTSQLAYTADVTQARGGEDLSGEKAPIAERFDNGMFFSNQCEAVGFFP